MSLLLAALILHNATFFDRTGTMRPAVDVVIEGSKLQIETEHRHRGEVIDVSGKYVLPGFVDTHVHVFEDGGAPRIQWDVVRNTLQLLLQHGVTTIRDPGSETEEAVKLRGMLDEGTIEGPRLLTAGRILISSNFDQEPFVVVRTADEIRSEIRKQKSAGVDFIKIYASMPPELVKVAIDEAHAQTLPIIGHLQRTTWTEAARLGIDFIAHGAPWSPEVRSLYGRVAWLEQLDLKSPAVREMVREMASRGVVVDPTLIAQHTKFFGNSDRWLNNPDNTLVPESERRRWREQAFTRDWTPRQYAHAQKVWPRQLALVKALFDGGVRLTVGTDTPTAWIVPGASFHDEMALLVSAGIPPRDVLLMATYYARDALKVENADLVVLSRNPIENIRNTRSIEMVITRGSRRSGPASARPASGP